MVIAQSLVVTTPYVGIYTSRESMAPQLKLIYFAVPGRAETTRVILSHAGLEFEDFIVQGEAWPELKPHTPFGQIPVLEVDGKQLAQSSAIERYVAKLANLYPEDAFEAAKVDELQAYTWEIRDLFVTIRHVHKELEAQAKARSELAAGPLLARLDKLTELLTSNGGKYFVSNKLTLADFAVHGVVSFLASGFLEGVPKTLFNDYPKLKEHHASISNLPGVAKFYANVTDGPKLAYKQLP